MKANDPFRKNVRFGIGVFFTVLEGLLSACVYSQYVAFFPNCKKIWKCTQ